MEVKSVLTRKGFRKNNLGSDDVFAGPNATFTNDIFLGSKIYQNEFLRTTINSGASIGANSTILVGFTIGQYAFDEVGAVVVSDVLLNAVLVGGSARITQYFDEDTVS
ncbi:hypothetical protein N9M29_01455 [Alphaproteobacteria bacterium]|nr:hypothetical protein [Alphaproteobacteria bacterium]MDA9581438.1 hypothetical protein [bacterium]MDA8625703.1 hypothetical protein [Alphaproteobacteria bacterium]MDA8642646.1 hypothetical protein [Alphaproteobacteria bacterium]MDA8666458.1 hypothetical protein [Alphaproteobacteria bacterium]